MNFALEVGSGLSMECNTGKANFTRKRLYQVSVIFLLPLKVAFPSNETLYHCNWRASEGSEHLVMGWAYLSGQVVTAVSNQRSASVSSVPHCCFATNKKLRLVAVRNNIY